MSEVDRVEGFIARWSGVSGGERANYQLFLTELAEVLELPKPEPATEDDTNNAYCFERRVTVHHGDGTTSPGFIDLYRRGCFVLEAKDVKNPTTGKYDLKLQNARSQAERYARALPIGEGRPPFLVVVDIGHRIELYSEFTRSGATYVPYPDPRSYRLSMVDLRRDEVRERLRKVWLEPLALDPSRHSARVTREIAERLARVARGLEEAGHDPEVVAGFLTRCLFTFFAEDVGLIPKQSFQQLLVYCAANPGAFVPLLEELWRQMDTGGFSAAIRSDVLHFNGKLFRDATVIPLPEHQIRGLAEAAQASWNEVEPAIFGTLLERALNPTERHRLGAHYTPRAYVERLVMPTVIEPLREDWATAQAAALTLANEGDTKGAIAEVRRFHEQLSHVRVLDPACGSANFLYVTMEHMKRLEGEVLNLLEDLGASQIRLDTAGFTVDPHQFLGIELNPRAAAIAELVLWIGYLQWHFRTRGNVMPEQPVLRDFRNIEHRDAILAYERREMVVDEHGRQVTQWDGRTTKRHPVTGEQVPDESAQAPVERYVNPRKAEWPEADFVVGNPPFIGSKLMRASLGDGYVDALLAAWPEIPQATDLVTRWWHHAAALTRAHRLRRFGLITTNTIRQTYVRRAIEPHLTARDNPISLVFAVPDHPWVDSTLGAAVRIAMTVAERGSRGGRLLEVTKESGEGDDLVASLAERTGRIHPDLTVGPDVTAARGLQANAGICSVGMKTIGAGFLLDELAAARISGGADSRTAHDYVRPYMNGRDLAQQTRNLKVLDFYGFDESTVRERFPAAYQHLLVHVKPERDQNRNPIFKRQWWVLGHPRPQFRVATTDLSRYIATIETSKHRFFTFLPRETVPDSTLVTVALADCMSLGILSSRVHVAWALVTGGRLGVGNDPRYNKTRCFETFPFPLAGSKAIATLAEQLDAHRKRQQAAHAALTLTGMYNVLEKLRAGEELTAKERVAHEHGLVSVLKQLHDELDLAVLEAYGWSDLTALMEVTNGNRSPGAAGAPSREEAIRSLDETLLERLVALNAERAAEEARGLIRWLRPEFQAKGTVATDEASRQGALELEIDGPAEEVKVDKRPWPAGVPEQILAVNAVLTASPIPLSPDAIAAHFKATSAAKRRLGTLLETLVALGQVERRATEFAARR
jgi:hypothetical protein